MNKVKKKGYVGNSADAQLKILFALFRENRPMKQIEISKSAGLPKSHVNYHLPGLLGKKLILQSTRDGDDYYTLQPFILRDEIFSELMDQVSPLIETIANNLILDENDDKEAILKDNFSIFLKFLDIGME
jgi:predicted transcriptional regulator